MTTVDTTLAACRNTPTDLFFPPRGDNGERARTICRSCPIRAQCLTAAVARNERFGVWGGAGEPARRKLRRAYVAGGAAWDLALTGHFEALDAGRAVDVTGENITHARRGSYAKGCRCGACSIAAVMPDSVLALIGRVAA